jgi:hypothetical protein
MLLCETPARLTSIGISDIADALLMSSRGWFSVLVYYGDDSGNHGKGPFVLGGYLARASDWFHMENDWAKVLAQPPAIEYFKMSECYWLKGQFSGWDRIPADAKLSSLVAVVERYKGGLIELSSMMDWDEYRSAIGNGPFKNEFHSPYFFCLHGVVSQTTKVLEKINSQLVVQYVFDHQSNLNHDSAKQYYQVRRYAPKELTRFMGSISHEDDKILKPLQIADLIAWHIRRSFAKPPEDNGHERPELLRLRDGIFLSQCVTVRASGVAQMVIDVEAAIADGAHLPKSEELE